MNQLLSVIRYDTFGALVADDILNSYPKDSQLVGVARAMIAVVVTLCYPLQSHPSRGSALVVIFIRGNMVGSGGSAGCCCTVHVAPYCLSEGAHVSRVTP